MSVYNFISSVKSLIEKMDEKKLKLIGEIEKKYGVTINEELKQFIINETSKFFEYNGRQYRLMSINEILIADVELHLDLTQLKLIPIFDIMDNDFIVYDFSKEMYCVFNIIDKSKFLTSNTIEGVINEL